QQQQQQQQQQPHSGSSTPGGGKHGTDWMKLAGGMAAGGLTLAGGKKLLEQLTEDKHKPAQHY
ncbi:hypothetical protein BGZ99_010497, partial [Dissophora globulifera]